jgi:hypothetical protein
MRHPTRIFSRRGLFSFHKNMIGAPILIADPRFDMIWISRIGRHFPSTFLRIDGFHEASSGLHCNRMKKTLPKP